MNKLVSIFGKKELQAIAGGTWGRKVVWLLLISVGSLFALGAAKSVQDFLEDKMNSKWVQLVEVSWPKACNDQLQLDPAEIFFQELHGQFNVEEVEAIVTQNMKFYDDQANADWSKVGFVSEKNDILFALLSDPSSESQFVKGDAATLSLLKPRKFGKWSSKEGVVVTQAFLSKLGFSDDVEYVSLFIKNEFEPLPLPVAAVVKSLPSSIDVLMHSDLKNSHKKYLGSGRDVKKDKWSQRLNEIREQTFSVPQSVWNDASKGVKNQFKKVSRRESPSYLDHVILKAKSVETLNLPTGWEGYKWTSPGAALTMPFGEVSGDEVIGIPPSFVGVLFENLDSVMEFQNFVENDSSFGRFVCPAPEDDRPSLKVDLGKVVAKGNINLFNKVADFLRFCLMLAAASLLVVRCNMLFQLHIEKHSASIGTIKAFGLSNASITSIYAGIALLLLSVSFVLSYLVVAAVGPLSIDLIKAWLGLRPEDAIGLSFDNIMWYEGLLVFVIFPVVFVAWRIRDLLQRSPGALVFGRKTS